MSSWNIVSLGYCSACRGPPVVAQDAAGWLVPSTCCVRCGAVGSSYFRGYQTRLEVSRLFGPFGRHLRSFSDPTTTGVCHEAGGGGSLAAAAERHSRRATRRQACRSTRHLGTRQSSSTAQPHTGDGLNLDRARGAARLDGAAIRRGRARPYRGRRGDAGGAALAHAAYAAQGSNPRLADRAPGRSCSAAHTFEPRLGQSAPCRASSSRVSTSAATTTRRRRRTLLLALALTPTPTLTPRASS
eukprot:scaffold34264_cov64-Phaeocystis_antarctica.AAC.4